MKNEFTSNQAADVLTINRNTFQAWMSAGFFQTSVQSSTRRGVRNLFNKYDLCRIQLFQYFLSMGFQKMEAAVHSRISFENVGKESGKFKYIIQNGRFNNIAAGMTEWNGTITASLDPAKIIEATNDNNSVLIINLVKIIDQVDSSIEGYKDVEGSDND